MNFDNTYNSAVMRRRTYPLFSGLYKLRETQGQIKGLLHTVNNVMQRKSVPYDELLGGCLRSESKEYVASIPKRLAELLGYNIAPAIQALVGDGLTQEEISDLHPDFRISGLLSRCKHSGRSNIRIKQLLEHFDDALCVIIDYAELHKRY